MQIEISELDVVYLSYDEPKKEEFWAQISAELPWATRVDGVKGSDAAHKAAAAAAGTEHFVLVDGDNIPDWDFFNQALEVPEGPFAARWKARNIINGLAYGNGGLSLWHRDFVAEMRSHENSDGSPGSDVEFCFLPNYHAMHDVVSTTYPNGSPKHAWRAGFREGVKMCLDRGEPFTKGNLQNMHSQNMRNLNVWHNIGLDVENGEWAIWGARHGSWMTMLGDWDYRLVADFDALDRLWEFAGKVPLPSVSSRQLGNELNKKLGLPILDIDPVTSSFFKATMPPRPNKGIAYRE